MNRWDMHALSKISSPQQKNSPIFAAKHCRGLRGQCCSHWCTKKSGARCYLSGVLLFVHPAMDRHQMRSGRSSYFSTPLFPSVPVSSLSSETFSSPNSQEKKTASPPVLWVKTVIPRPGSPSKGRFKQSIFPNFWNVSKIGRTLRSEFDGKKK